MNYIQGSASKTSPKVHYTTESSNLNILKELVTNSNETDSIDNFIPNIEEVNKTKERLNQAIMKCEKEKDFIIVEINRMKEQKEKYEIEEKIDSKWNESDVFVNKALGDLSSNIEYASELKFMKKGIQKEMSEISEKAEKLKKMIMKATSGREDYHDRAMELNEKFATKRQVLGKLEATIESNKQQRLLIFKLVKKIVNTLLGRLCNQEVKKKFKFF